MTKQEVWVECNSWCVHIVGRGEKEEREDQLALSIVVSWIKKKASHFKGKAIFLDQNYVQLSTWLRSLGIYEYIVLNAFREIKGMKVIFRIEMNFP